MEESVKKPNIIERTEAECIATPTKRTKLMYKTSAVRAKLLIELEAGKS